ncbi:MAG: OmpA family protein [Deltaproteobacteria bacterium]|nr:OmpA family protein [Deltaproteobacteria bacterium]
MGPVNQLRLGLHGEYFGANDFLIAGDANQRLAGGLTVGYTLRRDIELFGALLNSSNRNQRNRDPDDRDPELIKTFGDLIVGAKWILPLSSAATFGVELGLKFLSGISELAVSPSSTSWWLGPLFTYDFRRARDIPLRFHAGASFYADNSSNLHALSGVTRATKEVAMFAYGISPNRLRLALALDAPLEKFFPRVPVVPFVEYHAAYVTADADRDFQDFMPPNCDPTDITKKACVDNRDIQFLTLGARAAVYRGITTTLGVDIRIRSPGFPYGPPTPPFNVMFGVSYPWDLNGLTRTVVVTRTVEPDGPWKTDGNITGVVRSAKGGRPIAGAIVAVLGRPRARAATDADGGFATANLRAGPVDLQITAADFEPTTVNTTITPGQSVNVAVQMVPVPPVAKVHGQVKDQRGTAVQASLKFVGPTTLEIRSDATGAYASALPVGSYQVHAEVPGLIPQDFPFEALGGEDKALDFVLRAVPDDPNVALNGQNIIVKKPIRFVNTTAKLTPATEQLLNGVGQMLAAHAEIKRLRIVAHWDSSLPKPKAVAVTQAQAEAVRDYLVARGVAGDRLITLGHGSAKPLVPNLTPANRSRNRRVEFQIE